MQSENLRRVIDAFGPSEVQKQRMLDGIAERASAKVRRKKSMAKVLVIAAAISLCSGTAVAFSNTEWFKGVFGNSIYLVEDQILTPMKSAADDRFKLTLEGVLSDAYSSIAIVAVEALNEQSGLELEQIASRLQIGPLQQQIRASSSSVVELHHLSEKNKKRFMAEFRSKDEPLNGDLEIRLTTGDTRLALSAPTTGTIPTLAVQLDEGYYATADYVPQTVLISPISIFVKGYERTIRAEIPNPRVILHFADGTTIDVFNRETSFGGSRFPEEGTTTVSAQFVRIIDLNQLRFITVDGKEYSVGDQHSP